jgi:ABC-2 type transport system permease protein
MTLGSIWARTRRELSQMLAITVKDIRVYYLSPPMVMFGLLMPFLMFFSFSVSRGLSIGVSVARLLAITTFFTASSAGPVILPMERKTRSYERMLVAPVSIFSILFGKAMVGAAFGLAVSLLTLVVAALALGAPLASLVGLLLAMILASISFSAMGLLFALWPTDSATPVGSTMMPATLIRWPLMFISGVFVPLDQMSPVLRVISYISPLTYTQDLMNHTVLGHGLQSQALDWVVLLASTGVFLVVTFWFDRIQRRRGY